MTQRERVLAMLRSAGRSGVFSHDFYAEHLPRFAARVRDLKDDGFVISSTPERRNGKPGARYKLISEPNGGEVLGVTQPSASGPQCATPGVVDASVGPRQSTPEAPSEEADSSGPSFDWDAFKRPRKHDTVETS